MSRKSTSQFKILNDTLDLMTLMTHAFSKTGCANTTMCLPLLLKMPLIAIKSAKLVRKICEF